MKPKPIDPQIPLVSPGPAAPEPPRPRNPLTRIWNQIFGSGSGQTRALPASPSRSWTIITSGLLRLLNLLKGICDRVWGIFCTIAHRFFSSNTAPTAQGGLTQPPSQLPQQEGQTLSPTPNALPEQEVSPQPLAASLEQKISAPPPSAAEASPVAQGGPTQPPSIPSEQGSQARPTSALPEQEVLPQPLAASLEQEISAPPPSAAETSPVAQGGPTQPPSIPSEQGSQARPTSALPEQEVPPQPLAASLEQKISAPPPSAAEASPAEPESPYSFLSEEQLKGGFAEFFQSSLSSESFQEAVMNMIDHTDDRNWNAMKGALLDMRADPKIRSVLGSVAEKGFSDTERFLRGPKITDDVVAIFQRIDRLIGLFGGGVVTQKLGPAMNEFVNSIFQNEQSFSARIDRYLDKAHTWEDPRILNDWNRIYSVQVGEEVICGTQQGKTYYEKIVSSLRSKNIQNPEETACELMLRQWQGNEFSHRFLPPIVALLSHLIAAENLGLNRDIPSDLGLAQPEIRLSVQDGKCLAERTLFYRYKPAQGAVWRFARVVVQNVLDPAHIENKWQVSVRMKLYSAEEIAKEGFVTPEDVFRVKGALEERGNLSGLDDDSFVERAKQRLLSPAPQ